jgi:hypothetical protein
MPLRSVEKPKFETPLDVVLAIQCVLSSLPFSVMAVFWGGLVHRGGVQVWLAVL